MRLLSFFAAGLDEIFKSVGDIRKRAISSPSGMAFVRWRRMSHLLEIATIEGYRVFFVKSQDSRRRCYFSAYVQLPESDQMILDDRILPRLKERLRQVVSLRSLYSI